MRRSLLRHSFKAPSFLYSESGMDEIPGHINCLSFLAYPSNLFPLGKVMQTLEGSEETGFPRHTLVKESKVTGSEGS